MGIPADDVRAYARDLFLRRRAVEIIRTLGDAGISAILIKGPITADWLYPGSPRTYRDIDLLVPPELWWRAIAVLIDCGFADGQPRVPGLYRADNEVPLRHEDSTLVDLHRRLIGVPASAEHRCWTTLWQRSIVWRLSDTHARALDEVARAMHLALHAAQSRDDERARNDLAIGLQRLPSELWRRATDLADAVGCRPAFNAGLGTYPGGNGSWHHVADVVIRGSVSTRRGQEALAVSRLAESSLPRRDLLRMWIRETHLTSDGFTLGRRLGPIAIMRALARSAAGAFVWALAAMAPSFTWRCGQRLQRRRAAHLRWSGMQS